jgi:hypothetical protein
MEACAANIFCGKGYLGTIADAIASNSNLYFVLVLWVPLTGGLSTVGLVGLAWGFTWGWRSLFMLLNFLVVFTCVDNSA